MSERGRGGGAKRRLRGSLHSGRGAISEFTLMMEYGGSVCDGGGVGGGGEGGGST